jgi:hypothetical protein
MKSALAVLLFAVAAHAAEAPPLGRTDLARIDDAFHLAANLGPRIWPGFAADSAPVIFIRGDFEYLVNSVDAPSPFVATSQQFRGMPVFVRPRVFPPNLEASFPAIGRDAVVIGTPEATKRSSAAWELVFCHELFHVYQRSRGMDAKIASLAIGPRDDASWQLNYPFPYDDPRVVRALHILGHELATNSDIAAEALENVFALLDPKSAAYLRFVITNEGVARYFEYRLAELAAHEQPEVFADAWRDTYSKFPTHIPNLGRADRSRTEFYTLGLALALQLDHLRPQWQSSYFEPGVWLDDLYR